MSNLPEPAELRDVTLSLGEDGFPQALAAFVDRAVKVDHLSLMVFDHEIVPHLVGAASTQPGEIAINAGRLYEQASFYRHDPNTERIRSGRSAHTAMLFRLRAADIANADYRDRIYTRYGLVERLSLIDQVKGQWVLLNLYRHKRAGAFSDADLSRLRSFAPLLTALAGKHASLSPPQKRKFSGKSSAAYIERLLASISERLTERERQVCARALVGLTVPGIALDLGIKEPTVATLRRRAYAKLNISSLNELFAMCIGRLAG